VIQSICLLGSFRICATSPICISKKGKALLALLAIAALDGEGMSRARLTTMLWPYQDSERARHSLRNCLGYLRKSLHADAIKNLIPEFDCRADMLTDVADFARLENSNNQHDLELAAELYRGDLLHDFCITSEPFEEWLRNERDLWQQRAMTVLSRLSATAADNADHGTSIRAARRMVHIEPWNEEGQRLLIGALDASGHRGEAARQYRRCCDTLKAELGVDPDPETTDLAVRLFANKRPAPIPPDPEDEVLLRHAMKMLDGAREQIRDNLEALHRDRALFAKVVLRLDHHLDTKHVGRKSLEAMRDAIKARLGDECLAPAPRPQPQSNGEVAVELLA
jgi:DNA-binding SARP family transcriptional activator